MKSSTFKKLKCHPKYGLNHKTIKNIKGRDKRDKKDKLHKSSKIKNNETRSVDYSCLDDRTLKSLKLIWNKRNPDRVIKAKSPMKIWTALQSKMMGSCNNEYCWVRKTIPDLKTRREIEKNQFAPIAPSSWKKNKNEWLSNYDIQKVMSQYESIFPEFRFFGPSPIDFDDIVDGMCVWPELCHFKLTKHIKDKKTKLGFIFNTDTHNQSGSHWIAMYLDLNDNILFYFDSNGIQIPERIDKLAKRIIDQCKSRGHHVKFLSNMGMKHQYSYTECGMYCLYFIITLLTDKQSYDFFQNHRITDKLVEKYRNVYFNII